jgi:PAS domain S-box-containing protein
MSILAGLRREAVTQHDPRAFLTALLFASAAVFLVDLVSARGIADGHLYIAVVVLGLLLQQDRDLVIVAVLCSALAALGGWLSPPGADPALTALNRAIAIGVIWVVTVFSLLRSRGERARASADRGFRDFVENAPVAMHWADADGRIVWANAAELTLLGYATHDYVGHHVAEFHADPETAEHILSMLRAGTALNDHEARLRRGDGSIRNVLISSNAYFRDGRFVHTRCYTRDVTGHRQAQRESESRFRELADAAPVMIWVSDANRQCVYVNRAWREFTGRPIEAGLGTGWYDSVHPEDQERCREAFGAALAQREPCNIVYRMRNASGEYRWIRDHGVPRLSESGEVLGYVGSAYDITDLKEAAALLKRSNELLEERVAQRTEELASAAAQYRELVESLDAIVWRCDPATMRFTFVSPQAERILGHPLAEWTGDPQFFLRHLHPQDRDRIVAYCTERTRALQHHQMEYRMLAADGRAVWLRDIVHVAVSDGRPVELIGVMLDVTDRKRAEDALRESEGRLSAFLDHNPAVIFIKDRDGRYRYINREFERHIGIDRAQVIGRFDGDFLPADQAAELRAHDLAVLSAGTALQFEETVRSPTGPRTYIVTKFPLEDADGRHSGTCGIAVDVTARRRAEAARLESDLRLAAFMEHSPAMMFIKDRDGRYLQVNREFEAQFGLRREAVIDRTDEEIFEAAQAAAFRANDRAVLAAGTALEVEEEAMYKDGQRHVNIVSKFPLRDARGTVTGTCGIAFDITERKRAERALRESEHRFRILIEGVKDYAIFMLDPDGRVASWNRGAERIMGYAAQEIVGRHFSGLYPAQDAAAGFPDRLLETARKTGRAGAEGLRARKDGSTFFASVTLTALRDEAGELMGFTKVIRDITERRRAEEEIRNHTEQLQALSRRLVDAQERERKQLARELHDRVGQSMAALKINLEIFKEQLAGCESAVDAMRLDDSLQLIEQTVDTIANLTSDLRPPMLDDYGLVAALRWYASLFERRTGIEVSVLPAAESAPRLSAEAEAAFFRIAQEAMTNVAKHAHARHLRITLRQGGSSVILRIADDGCGFDVAQTQKRRNRASWGMITMRERAQAVGAQLTVEAAPGQGTTVSVEVAQTPRRKHA